MKKSSSSSSSAVIAWILCLIVSRKYEVHYTYQQEKMSFAAIFISDFRCFIISYICYLPIPVSMVERVHLNISITPWIDNLLDIELGGAAEVEGSIIKFNEFMNSTTKTLEWHNVLKEHEKMRRATSVPCFFFS